MAGIQLCALSCLTVPLRTTSTFKYLHHDLKHRLLFFFFMSKRLGQVAQPGRAGTRARPGSGEDLRSASRAAWERRRGWSGRGLGRAGHVYVTPFSCQSHDALRLGLKYNKLSLLRKKHFQCPFARTPFSRLADCTASRERD